MYRAGCSSGVKPMHIDCGINLIYTALMTCEQYSRI